MLYSRQEVSYRERKIDKRDMARAANFLQKVPHQRSSSPPLVDLSGRRHTFPSPTYRASASPYRAVKANRNTSESFEVRASFKRSPDTKNRLICKQYIVHRNRARVHYVQKKNDYLRSCDMAQRECVKERPSDKCSVHLKKYKYCTRSIYRRGPV